MSNILITDSHIILPSDRSGKMQLYLYSMTGQLLRTLTSGPEVTNVYGYDDKTGAVYYQTVGDTPMERCVRTTSANGKTQLLSEKKGWNKFMRCSDLTASILSVFGAMQRLHTNMQLIRQTARNYLHLWIIKN